MTRSCVEACMVVSADSEPYEEHGLGADETIDKASTGCFVPWPGARTRKIRLPLYREYQEIPCPVNGSAIPLGPSGEAKSTTARFKASPRGWGRNAIGLEALLA